MKYGYYLGPSGSGKTYRLISDVIERSLKEKGRMFLIIVPDQYTMATQKQVVEMHPAKGIMNIDVLSFGRLYHGMTDEKGAPEEVLLDDTGKNLLIRRAALLLEGQLPALGSSLDKPGYIHEIKSVISELMQYGYGPDDMEKLIAASEERPALKERLKDIAKIYRSFNEYRVSKYMTTEERNNILAAGIIEKGYINDTVVYFDGFTGFTPVQMNVIRAMFLRCHELWFSVAIEEEALKESYEGELFALSKETISRIDRLAGDLKNDTLIEKAGDMWMRRDESGRSARFESDAIAHIERNIFRKNAKPADFDGRDVYMFMADDPRKELMAVCARIRKLITEKGALYRDIAIVTGDPETYGLYAKECFEKYDIPYFLDSMGGIGVNPFTDFIKSGLKVIERDFSYDTVMSMIRTGFTDITPDEADILDNYIYATGVRGYSKYKGDFRRIPDYLKIINRETGKKEISEKGIETLGMINSIRKKVLDIVSPLLPFMSGKHRADHITEQFYAFIKNNCSAKKINEYVSYFAEKGDIVREKEYSQLYEKIISLLDVIHSLLGDDEVTVREYSEIFEAGLSEIKIGMIPGITDYVLLGDIERSRLGSIKYLFFMGLNDGIIPARTGKGGLISDSDREFFAEREDITLAPSPKEKIYTQRFYLYLNMTKPSRELYLSYSGADSDGKAKRPSYLVDRIKEILPGISVNFDHHEDDKPAGENQLFDRFAEYLRKYARGLCDYEELADLYLFCLIKDKDRTEEIIRHGFKRYESSNLQRETVHAIYGNELKNSVTRLEKFAACACSHFLKYGLNLNDRETPELREYDNGSLMHNTLKRFSDMIEGDNKRWSDLNEEEQDKYISKAFEDELASGEESKYDLSGVNRYERDRVRNILGITVKTVGKQLKKCAYNPLFTEMNIDEDVDGDFGDDESMKITGKIDRVDVLKDKESQTSYLRVIDYKSSSSKDIEPGDFFEGLSLQLMLYMNSALKTLGKEYEKVVPAGMYYYHLINPIVEADPASPEPDDEALEKSIGKELVMTGLTLDDVRYDILTDIAKGENGKSEIYKNVGVKDGKLVNHDSVVSLEDMNKLLGYTDEKICELTKDIFDGRIGAFPKGKKTCEYCIYSDVCGFDRKMPGCEIKDVPKMSVSDVLLKIDEKHGISHSDEGENEPEKGEEA